MMSVLVLLGLVIAVYVVSRNVKANKLAITKFQGNKADAVKLSAQLILDLQGLANDSNLDAKGKLDGLKSKLEDAMKQHRDIHKGGFSKAEHSDFHRICSAGIDDIQKQPIYKEQQAPARNKM